MQNIQMYLMYQKEMSIHSVHYILKYQNMRLLLALLKNHSFQMDQKDH